MIEDISPAEFLQRRENDCRWQLVDVREAWEIATVSIADSIAIPMAEIPSRLEELDKSKPLAVLCHSGVRSYRTAEFLVAQGFADIGNITGGIEAWALEVDHSLARY